MMGECKKTLIRNIQNMSLAILSNKENLQTFTINSMSSSLRMTNRMCSVSMIANTEKRYGYGDRSLKT